MTKLLLHALLASWLLIPADTAWAGAIKIKSLASRTTQQAVLQGTTIILRAFAGSFDQGQGVFDGVYLLLKKGDGLPFSKRTFVLKITKSNGAVVEYVPTRSDTGQTLYVVVPSSAIDVGAKAALWAEGFDWPFDVVNRSVSSDYEEYRTIGCGVYHYHSGEDWNKVGTADNGDAVLAADFGQVVDMYEMSAGNGWFIALHHTHNDEDYYTAYLHVTGTQEYANNVYTENASGNRSSQFFVNGDTSKPLRLGTNVKRGDMIARIKAGTSHLHFEIKKKAGLRTGSSYNWHTLLNASWYRAPDWQCSYTTTAKLDEDGFLKPSDFINANRPLVFAFPDALPLP